MLIVRVGQYSSCPRLLLRLAAILDGPWRRVWLVRDTAVGPRVPNGRLGRVSRVLVDHYHLVVVAAHKWSHPPPIGAERGLADRADVGGEDRALPLVRRQARQTPEGVGNGRALLEPLLHNAAEDGTGVAMKYSCAVEEECLVGWLERLHH